MKLPTLLIAAAALSACGQTGTKTVEKRSMSAIEAMDIAEADATCSHGTIGESRRFVLCEDGALRREGVELALAQPADPKLDIEAIAARYERAAQELTGIEVATYGSITPKMRRNAPKPKPASENLTDKATVRIDGVLFDVYALGTDEANSGMIFVEKPRN